MAARSARSRVAIRSNQASSRCPSLLRTMGMRILNEIICPFESWAGLAERCQILLFDLIQALLVTNKQPDGGAGCQRVETIGIERSLNTRLSDAFLYGDRPSVLIPCSLASGCARHSVSPFR